MSKPHFGLSVRMKLTLPKVGTWSLPGLPKTQSLIAGVKTLRIGVFFMRGHFGHLQPKLWAKKGLAVWFPTTKSQESISSQRLQKEWNKALERFWGELQLCFRPHSNWRSEPGDMSSQSPGSPTQNSFGTLPWESQEKVPFGCGSHGATQRIQYGGRWWLPLSPSRGESSESKVARSLSQHQKGAKWVLTNLWLVLDAGPCNNIIVPLSSLIPGLLARPSYPL